MRKKVYFDFDFHVSLLLLDRSPASEGVRRSDEPGVADPDNDREEQINFNLAADTKLQETAQSWQLSGAQE